MKLKITVHGVAYEVDVDLLDAGEGFAPAAHHPRPERSGGSSSPGPETPQVKDPAARRPEGSTLRGAAGEVISPIAGTVLEIKCRSGAPVERDQELMVLEAMKMEASITSPTSGTIRSVEVAAGDAVREGQLVARID